MDTNICKLCKDSIADKKNSHIISKFIGKELFRSNGKKLAALQIEREKSRYIQSIPTEDFIFCSNCEKKFSVLETLIARKFLFVKNYKNNKDLYKEETFFSNKILQVLDICPLIYKLFIYSLIWRTSISSHPTLKGFFLNEKLNEELRFFLSSNLCMTETELKSAEVKFIPTYHFFIIQPESTKERGVFSLSSVDEDTHIMYLVDFAIVFFSNENKVSNTYKFVSNNQNNLVLFLLADSEKWLNFNKFWVKRLQS